MEPCSSRWTLPSTAWMKALTAKPVKRSCVNALDERRTKQRLMSSRLDLHRTEEKSASLGVSSFGVVALPLHAVLDLTPPTLGHGVRVRPLVLLAFLDEPHLD